LSYRTYSVREPNPATDDHKGANTYPDKKALKGKLVTRTQYTNCITPDRTMNAKKASMSLRRSGVCCMYDFQSVDTAIDVSEVVVVDDDDGFAVLGQP
jgi:hypothetical protein